MPLSAEELNQYDRQLICDNWGVKTQEKIKNATVFVAGAGGLGSPVALYLAAAGIGTITICDCDSVDLSNLNRQILHGHKSIGMEKTLSAKQSLESINRNIDINAVNEKITVENVEKLIEQADIVLDCMDNFPARYCLAEAARKKGIPFVYGSVWGMEGRVTVIQPPSTPCLRCVFPEAPPQETFPIIGAIAGVIGSIQALEAIKYLSGTGENLRGDILVVDCSDMTFRVFHLHHNSRCPVCSPAGTGCDNLDPVRPGQTS